MSVKKKNVSMGKAASFGVLLKGENRERFFGWLTCI